MNTMLLNLYVKFQSLMNRDEGQDLIEYALLAALLALACTAAVSGVANGIKTLFNGISSTLGTV
jgi:pilus assembly protein Flp/PilA